MYKIGDFSKLVNSSIRTLRYYDDIDLFKPSRIDIYTGYRYYSEEQIQDFKIIQELKEVGFSLEEIIENWNDFDEEKLLKKKRELYLSQNIIKEKIRKIDHLRNRVSNGKIVPNDLKEEKIIRR